MVTSPHRNEEQQQKRTLTEQQFRWTQQHYHIYKNSFRGSVKILTNNWKYPKRQIGDNKIEITQIERTRMSKTHRLHEQQLITLQQRKENQTRQHNIIAYSSEQKRTARCAQRAAPHHHHENEMLRNDFSPVVVPGVLSQFAAHFMHRTSNKNKKKYTMLIERRGGGRAGKEK